MMKSIIGVNGTMELYEDHIVLKRGRLLGNFDKTTYLKDVIEVQLKKPGLTRAALVVSTALDHNGGNLTSPDANAIFLASKQWDEGVAFKRLVEDQVSRIKGSAESSPHSPADELTKFNSHRPNISSVISGYKQPSKSAQSIEITGFIEKSKPPEIIFLYTLLPLTA